MTRRTVTLVGIATVVLGVGAAIGWTACGPAHRTDGGVGLVTEQSVAPTFSAPDQTGRVRSLEEFRGRAVVLYFYPRDGTPGCTREACAFRDAWDRLAATGAQVIGVSSNGVASHASFAQEHHLQFPLLSDGDGRIANSYGVRHFLGLDSRVTFILSPDGHIAKVFGDVDPGVHADEVIRELRRLQPSAAPVSPAPPAA